MANITEHFFNNKDELTSALTQLLSTRLQHALTAQPRASLLVSGGSSPAPAYRALSHLDINWQQVDVAMVDERWVDPSHPKSNETFIKQTLLQHHGAAANFITMKNAAPSAQQGLEQTEQAYQTLSRPFDITILGMGTDGHTASLFPHAQGLEQALTSQQLVCAIDAKPSEVTGEITERMSLTLHGIAQSKVVILLISGEQKRSVYQQALQGDNLLDMPLRSVLQHPDIELLVFWSP